MTSTAVNAGDMAVNKTRLKSMPCSRGAGWGEGQTVERDGTLSVTVSAIQKNSAGKEANVPQIEWSGKVSRRR